MATSTTFSTHYQLDVLTPPAEWQQSFYNANSSAIRPSSVVNVSLNILIYHQRPANFYSCLVYNFLIIKICISLSHPNDYFNMSERSNLAPFLLNFLKKKFDTFFFYLYRKLPNEGTNELSKDGFDWIALKVIFGCFATFCKFSQKRFDNFSLFLVHSCLEIILINWQEMDSLNNSKGYFQVSHIWPFSLPHVTLDDIERSNLGQLYFSWLFFINEACYVYSWLEYIYNLSAYLKIF